LSTPIAEAEDAYQRDPFCEQRRGGLEGQSSRPKKPVRRINRNPVLPEPAFRL